MKNALLESFRATKTIKVMLIIMTFMFCLSSVSALSVYAHDIGKKYPKLSFEEDGFFSDKIIDLELLSNGCDSPTHCWAIMNYTSYANARLPFNFDFKGKDKQFKSLNYDVYIRDYQQVIVDNIIETCDYNNLITDSNGFIHACSYTTNGQKTINKEVWNKQTVDFTRVAGSYIVKIETFNRPFNMPIDWAFSFEDISSDKIREHLAWWVNYDPTHYWALNETGTANPTDDMNNMTWLRQGGTYATGKIANAFYPQGTANALINSTAFKTLGSGNFTLAFWWKSNYTGAVHDFLGQGTLANQFTLNNHLSCMRMDSPAIDLLCFNGVSGGCSNGQCTPNDANPCSVGGILNDNVWRRYVITREDDKIRLYVNGTNYVNTTNTTDYNDVSFIGFKSADTGMMLDEVIVFKGFAWNTSDVTYDWNNGSGRSPYSFNPDVTVTLNSPANNTITNNTSVNFNVTITALNSEIKNYTLFVWYTNNSVAYSNTNTTSNNATVHINVTSSFTDNTYYWNTFSCSDNLVLSDCSWASSNRTFSIDTTSPAITINSPNGVVAATVIPYNVTVDFDVTDLRLSRCYFNGSFNSTITYVNCNETTNLTISSGGTQSFFAYSNDTAGNLRINSTTFYIITAEVSQVFNLSMPETSSAYFSINLTTTTGASTMSSKLNYNGTLYNSLSSLCVGVECFAYTIIDLPLISNLSTQRFFYWNITLNNASGSSNIRSTTKSHNTTVIDFATCNDTFGNMTLNYTVKDENNGTYLKSEFASTYNYWLGGGTVTKNYSYNNLTKTGDSFIFCIDPFNVTYKINSDTFYTADNYGDRKHYLYNASITNNTNNLILYLLNSVDYQKFFITVKEGVTEIANGRITITKYNSGTGTYTTVSTRETDANGEFIEYLDLDKDYRFIVTSSDGEVLGTVDKTATCQAAPCEMTLQLDESITSAYQEYNNDFGSNVVYNLSYNQTNRMVTFIYIDTSGLATYSRLEVLQLQVNETINKICDTSLYAVSGSISCNLTGYSGDFRANSYISRSPEKFIDYILIYINLTAEDLGLMGVFFTMMILIVVFFIFIYDISLGVLSLPLVMIVCKLIGFLYISWTPIIILTVFCVWIATKLK